MEDFKFVRGVQIDALLFGANLYFAVVGSGFQASVNALCAVVVAYSAVKRVRQYAGLS